MFSKVQAGLITQKSLLLTVILLTMFESITQAQNGFLLTPPNCFSDSGKYVSQYDCATMLNNLENSVGPKPITYYQPTNGKSGGPAGCNDTVTYGACVLSICRSANTKQDFERVPQPGVIVRNGVNPSIESGYVVAVAQIILAICAKNDNTGGKMTVYITNIIDGQPNQVDVQLSTKSNKRRRRLQSNGDDTSDTDDPPSSNAVAYPDNFYYNILRAENNVFLRREWYYQTAPDDQMNDAENSDIQTIGDGITNDIEQIIDNREDQDYTLRNSNTYYGTYTALNREPHNNLVLQLGGMGNDHRNYLFEEIMADAQAAIANEIVGLPSLNRLSFIVFGVYQRANNADQRPAANNCNRIGMLTFWRQLS